MSMTWKLKEGLKWSDGSDMTAQDAVFSWSYCVDENTGCTSERSFDGVVSVRAIDSRTVEITFDVPIPYPYQAFVGTQSSAGPSSPIVSARPPRAVKRPRWARAPTASSEANERGPQVVGTAAICRPRMPSSFRLHQPGRTHRSQSANPGPALGENRSEFMDGQNPHPFLTFKPIRQAMSMAIDRSLISEQLYGFAAEPTCNLIAGPPNYASTAQRWVPGPTKAQTGCWTTWMPTDPWTGPPPMPYGRRW